jgi:transcriptional regulator with XRE-family HTH domain
MSEERKKSPADAIGARVAKFRRRRKLKVSELAQLVGVSPSLISQIEHGQSRPSVTTLFSLGEALAVPVDAFFGEPDEQMSAQRERLSQRYVVRRDQRTAIEIEGGIHWERLTPLPLDSVEFFELVYGPRAESNSALYQHPGFEIALVLSGRFEIHVAFERYELEVGDSISFPSSMPHRYVNPTDEVARAVTVILPSVTATEF